MLFTSRLYDLRCLSLRGLAFVKTILVHLWRYRGFFVRSAGCFLFVFLHAHLMAP